MQIKIYDSLPDEARQIRTAVFVEEQGFNEEFDETDGTAAHIVMFDGERPIAVCRHFYDNGKKEHIIGRLAVLKSYRSRGLGAEILAAAEQNIKQKGGKEAALHAQLQAQEFYQKQGYKQFGSMELEEGCPHIWMKKKL